MVWNFPQAPNSTTLVQLQTQALMQAVRRDKNMIALRNSSYEPLGFLGPCLFGVWCVWCVYVCVCSARVCVCVCVCLCVPVCVFVLAGSAVCRLRSDLWR